MQGVAIEQEQTAGFAGRRLDAAPVDQLAEHLPGTDLVLIPAGIPRKPGMTRDDLFNVRAAADRHASPEHAKEWWSNLW